MPCWLRICDRVEILLSEGPAVPVSKNFCNYANYAKYCRSSRGEGMGSQSKGNLDPTEKYHLSVISREVWRTILTKMLL